MPTTHLTFITTDQFQLYVAPSRISQMLSDDTNGAPVDPATFITNPTLLELLDAGAAEIISNAVVGKRYTVGGLLMLAADLDGGTYTGGSDFGGGTITGGTVLPGLGAKLRRLNADLTWGLLVKFKKLAADDFARLCPDWPDALKTLDALRAGEIVFPVLNAPEAGLPSVVALGANVVGTIASRTELFGTAAVGPCRTTWRVGSDW